jgi:type II secretory pathway component PulF
MQAGTPIIKALEVTAQVINNSLYFEVLAAAKTQVERGVPLSAPLAQSPLFPTIATQMILVGEQTGRLDDVLLKIATYYETQAEDKIKNLSSLLEPVIIVIIGIAVGFMVYSILVPIYNVAQLQ